ncbi:MAG: UDP-3-O-[3-hydroxymyristoyl] N-acetylglucosamine deacetylase [Acidobacteria bacterium]|nr:MAG: UDP-3-O-[3-hydroxymyristoyl] N-acetylglucosamine deacetylase [Acidobacteriota bacterium]
MKFQQTLGAPISFSGVGLHTGASVNLKVVPAPPDTGLVFQRVDLDNFRIEANIKNVARVAYATTLMKQGVLLSTVEHLLSSLYIFGIDNAFIEINNLEVPILDGSALDFVTKIQQVGLKTQRAKRKFLVIQKALHLKDRDKTISILPAKSFQISYTIDFRHPLIGRQSFEFEASADTFAKEIAPARTFGFFHEVEELRKNGLVRGGSLENAVVLTEDGILNAILRFKDEFVRHKILDSIGDLSLIGRPLIGRIVAHKAGHAMHTHLVSKILSDRSLWRLESDLDWKPNKAANDYSYALPRTVNSTGPV